MARPGHKQVHRLIEAEAFRRIMAGDIPPRLDEFAQQLKDWLAAHYPDAAPMAAEAIQQQIEPTWLRRHELIRGGDP